jgi:hypothetical protein
LPFNLAYRLPFRETISTFVPFELIFIFVLEFIVVSDFTSALADWVGLGDAVLVAVGVAELVGFGVTVGVDVGAAVSDGAGVPTDVCTCAVQAVSPNNVTNERAVNLFFIPLL